jgi:hypothetical protein
METTKLTFAKGWIKFWSFFAGILQDQGGAASSKRFGFIAGLFMMYKIVEKSLEGGTVNDIVLYTAATFTFGLAGLSIPEWFAPKNNLVASKEKEKTNNKIDAGDPSAV